MMNWRNYNESLVKRDEILLDFDVIDNWHVELDKMNKDMKSRKFVYISRFIYQITWLHEGILSPSI